MHIWELETPLGRVARKLYYGTEAVLKPQPSYDELVPNIGHMIWIGGGRMDFLFYLSILSKLFVLKVRVSPEKKDFNVNVPVSQDEKFPQVCKLDVVYLQGLGTAVLNQCLCCRWMWYTYRVRVLQY